MSALRPAAHRSLTTLILSLREQLLPIAHTNISHTFGIYKKRKERKKIETTIVHNCSIGMALRFIHTPLHVHCGEVHCSNSYLCTNYCIVILHPFNLRYSALH